MKTNKLRIVIPLAILALAGIGFVANTGFGNLSAIGWQDISILCPLGALTTMLASKTVVPHAIISLVIAVVAIIILGRAFCGWICPVPVVSKLRDVFRKQESAPREEAEESVEDNGASATAHDAKAGGITTSEAGTPATTTAVATKTAAATKASTGTDIAAPLTEKEKKALKSGCHGSCGASAPSNSRHFILGASLLSAAIFGFPVFCLICPIGLSFAFVFVLIMLFGNGDVTWSVVLIPVLLLVEVVFFRKWCSHLCPLSALISLVGKANRTFRPSIDDSRCLETSHNVECGKCSSVCEVAIDPRHPEKGASWSECTRCRACSETCPGKAISFPLLPKTPSGDHMNGNAGGSPEEALQGARGSE